MQRNKVTDKLFSERYQELKDKFNQQDEVKPETTSQELSILIDVSGNIVSINPYIFIILGYMPNDIIGKSVMEFVYPEDIPLALKSLHKASQDLPYIKIYIRVLHVNKSLVLLEVQGRALMDAYGLLSSIILSCRVMDMENPLTEYFFGSEELLNLIFENAVDGISVHEEFYENRVRKLIKCNARYAELANRNMSDLYSCESTLAFQRELDADPVTRKSFDEAFTKSGVYKGLFSWIRPDGKKNIVEYSAIPIRLGERVLVIGIDRDITDRIHENEEKLLLYDRINRQQNAIVKISTSEEIIKGNSSKGFGIITEIASQIIAVERVSIWIGQLDENELTCEDLFEKSSGTHTHGQWLIKNEFPNYFSALNQYRIIDAHEACQDSRTIEFANSYLKPNQIKSVLHAPILYSGNLYGIVCFESVGTTRIWTSEDIHFAGEIADQTAQVLLYQERYQNEQALKKSEHQLRELNATKDKFFSIIAHDLRSPFNSIIGLSELLSSSFYSFKPEKVNHLISKIHEASKATYELLENLLTWARAQSNNLTIDMEPIRLRQSLMESIPLLKEQAEAKGIKMNIDIPFDVLVSADKNLLTLILRNLINNAIKFTHKGGEIRIHHTESKNEVEVIITDNGIGIPKEHIANLFKLESKHSTSGTDNEKGTGLGLILCKNFVEKMGGTIRVTSQPDLGSSFYLSLSPA